MLAISPDGNKVASAAGQTVRVWALDTAKELSSLGGHRRPPSAITVSKDAKSMVSWGPDRVIRALEMATGTSLLAFPAPPRTTLAAFSADGNRRTGQRG